MIIGELQIFPTQNGKTRILLEAILEIACHVEAATECPYVGSDVICVFGVHEDDVVRKMENQTWK